MTPPPPPTRPVRALPHVCDYREPDGTTAGTCHLFPPHGGPCPDCGLAVDCTHVLGWERALLCSVRDCEVHR